MKIFDDPMDQCLLCTGYSFEQDCPLRREFYLHGFQPGVQQKEWWRYSHTYLGLKTLIAYQSHRPVGHIELIPIEHAPRPVGGHGWLVVDCIKVDPMARGKGVGRALMEAAATYATEQGRGLAVLARRRGDFMPASFFLHLGFEQRATRHDDVLLAMPLNAGGPLRLLPMRFQPQLAADRVMVDFIHCPQCPQSGWALTELERQLAHWDAPISLRVHETGDRRKVTELGVAFGVYVDGREVGVLPPNPSAVLKAVRQAAEERVHAEEQG
jgi:GNAT superfamily N-acetyltransferase